MKRRNVIAVAASTLILASTCLIGTAMTATAASTLLSQGRPAVASTSENAGTPASAAVDGNAGTRWSSAFADPQWIYVDLGQSASITSVTLNWEAAYGRSFQIQTSADAATWTTVFSTTTGPGGVQNINLTGTGRYVRMLGTVRGTAYGYSLWEFQVFGTIGGGGTCGTANAAQGRPATASSVENATFPASAAVDGNAGTRWSSAFSDPQWIQIDFGGTVTICQAVLTWEAAYATAFQIQMSGDAATWTTVFSTTTGTGGTQTLNVSGTGRYLRIYMTARATQYGDSLFEVNVHTTGPVTSPSTSPTTSPSGPPPGNGAPPDSWWGDTSSIPAAQNVLTVKVLNRTNGQYPDSQVFWSFNGQTHSIAEQQYIDMPANSAGRMYFYLGSPTGQYWDFIEFTVGASVFNGNTTRVDGFRLKIAMRLHSHDGNDVQVGENYNTFLESRTATFNRFTSTVPTEFKELGTDQAPFNIPSPGNDPAFQAGGVYQNYWNAYASSTGHGGLTAGQIFGCAGPLAADSGSCSALNRHVAQLPQSQWSTPSLYYQAAPANYYAKFWHDNAISSLAYGFPYDDFAGQSSFISHGNPQYLLVAIGW